MNKKVVLAALLSIAIVFGVSAQRPPNPFKVQKKSNVEGDISPLKGQQKVNVVIDFDGTLVNGKPEEKYIADETKRMNATEKAEWLADWNEKLRSDAYAILVTKLNDEIKQFFEVGDYADAEYTINVQVRDITTGYFAGIVTKASAINAEVTFLETGTTTPFASIEFKKSSSGESSYIPYYVLRITMSFGELGEDIGKMVKKKLKK